MLPPIPCGTIRVQAGHNNCIAYFTKDKNLSYVGIAPTRPEGEWSTAILASLASNNSLRA